MLNGSKAHFLNVIAEERIGFSVLLERRLTLHVRISDPAARNNGFQCPPFIDLVAMLLMLIPSPFYHRFCWAVRVSITTYRLNQVHRQNH